MDPVKELRTKITQLTKEMREFLEKRDVTNAKAKKEEIRQAKELLEIELELEEEEKRKLENQEKRKKKKIVGEDTNEMRAVTKFIMKKDDLTEEERGMIKTDGNAAIIPKEFVNELIVIQKGFGSLKGLCDVIPVSKHEGTIPVVDLDQNELADIAEGADIVDGTLVTTDVTFKCKKVGLIQDITSETLEDAVIDVGNLVKKNFANIATIKENKKILDVITTNATEIVEATTYEDVETAIDSSLPSVKAGLVTLTNVAGYCLLKNMKDKQGRKLNLITEINGVEYFNNKPIVAVDNELLTLSEGKKNVFYVLNFKEAVKYIERKGITIAKSEEAGFTKDTTKIRILESFIPILGSKRSIKKIEF
jgi:HK97 family phage major capsid protein